ncbi:MAG: zf-HC2 domain-containing protein [Thermodesulfobacteriota bacterium]
MKDCREIRPMLAAYHDGELSSADRARVDEHLRGCAECSAVLDRLAGIDSSVGVPDPGPEYWDRFNRRVMERLDAGKGAPAEIVRPKRGWARRGLPYFLPAAAAAALLLLVVRQTGVDPFSRTAVPLAPPPSATTATAEKASPVPPPALPEKKKEAAKPVAREEAGRSDPLREERAPVGASERFSDESLGKSTLSVPAPSPSVPREAPAEPAPPSRADAALAFREEEKRAGSGARTEKGGEEAVAGVAAGMEGRAMAKRAAAPAAAPSVCDEARSLAGRGRLKEAEAAQRACLEKERAPEAQERGQLFLAELLDRQSRFAEADEVLRETRRQFPASRKLDGYLRQRPEVQGAPQPAR